MRWVYMVPLVAIVAIVVVFIVENNESTTVKLFQRSLTAPLSWFFLAIYFLGMWSGGTVVAFIKRAYHQATQRAEQKRASQPG